MPRGSGLYSQLMEKRRTLETAIARIDAVIRIVRTGKLTGGRRGKGKPMSEEHKKALSRAAKRRHAKAHKSKEVNRPVSKAINQPRPKEQAAAAAG